MTSTIRRFFVFFVCFCFFGALAIACCRRASAADESCALAVSVIIAPPSAAERGA